MDTKKPLIARLVVSLVIVALATPIIPSSAMAARLPGSAPATTPQAGETCVVLQPGPAGALDAYIKQDKVDERRGTDPELRVKTETGKLNRSLLRFDLSGLPADALVSQATLSLFVKDATGGAVTINARQLTASWNEAQVTWNDRDKAASLAWTSAGGDYAGSTLSSTVLNDTKNVWRTWDVTAAASQWKANAASNFGVILEAAVTNPKTEKKFKSSDDGTALQRPKLEVCYSSGVTVEPDNSGEGVAGLTKTYGHVVNVGNLTTVVGLTASSSNGWATRIYQDVDGDGVKDPEDTLISATPSLGPNVTYPILVQLDVPLSALSGAADVTTVTATAQATGGSDTATDRTQVGKLISVQPDHSVNATAGSALFFGHRVVNNGEAEDCTTVTASSSLGWTMLLWDDLNENGVHETVSPAEPSLSNPVCVPAGEMRYIVLEVRVPVSASAGVVNQSIVTATSGNSAGRYDTAADTISVFVNDPPVIDGRYDSIYTLSPDAQQVCYSSGGVLFGKLATFYQPTTNAVYMALAIDKDFVDNTYGINAIGWPSGHTFGNLTGSDHAQFMGYDALGSLKLDFKLDYISALSGTPSGYGSLGLGGDGGISTGSAASIQSWGTSIVYDLNNLGYCSGGNCSSAGTNLLVNSPATNAFYTPNATYPAWLFDAIYEVKIDIAAFGANGFGSLEVPYIHASPSKTGSNTVYAEPGVCPGEIGDFVWTDLNGNGIEDPGEPGINSVQVNLYQDSGDGAFNPATEILVATATTSAGGQYLFQNLAPNDYFVDVVDATVPAGFTITTANDPTSVINLGEGQSYLEADFGYSDRGSIGDTVFYDDDGSGAQNGAEDGIPGVTVQLFANGAGTCDLLVRSTVTDAGGHYLFDNLVAAHYCVVVPEGPGQNAPLETMSRTAGANPHIVNLASGQNYLMADFGYQGPGDIRGVVYYDWNQDQAQGLTEAGIASVQVCLFGDADKDGNPDSATPLACTTTDDQGAYVFNSLTAGGYVLNETDPSGLFSSTSNSISTVLIVTQGAGSSEDNDFGDLLHVSLGDMVFLDSNGNGVQDPGETAGLSGVPLHLTGVDVLGQAIDTVIITVNGAYAGTGLLPGSYVVTAPSNFSGYALTSPGAQSTVLSTAVTEDLTLDFGYVYPTGVPIQSFEAIPGVAQVALSWEVQGDGSLPFRVWRAENIKGLDKLLMTAEPVFGDAAGAYTYTDSSTLAGITYSYWLESVSNGQLLGPRSASPLTAASLGRHAFMPLVTRR